MSKKDDLLCSKEEELGGKVLVDEKYLGNSLQEAIFESKNSLKLFRKQVIFGNGNDLRKTIWETIWELIFNKQSLGRNF